MIRRFYQYLMLSTLLMLMVLMPIANSITIYSRAGVYFKIAIKNGADSNDILAGYVTMDGSSVEYFDMVEIEDNDGSSTIYFFYDSDSPSGVCSDYCQTASLNIYLKLGYIFVMINNDAGGSSTVDDWKLDYVRLYDGGTLKDSFEDDISFGNDNSDKTLVAIFGFDTGVSGTGGPSTWWIQLQYQLLYKTYGPPHFESSPGECGSAMVNGMNSFELDNYFNPSSAGDGYDVRNSIGYAIDGDDFPAVSYCST